MTPELESLLARPVEELSGRDLDAVVVVECFGVPADSISRDPAEEWICALDEDGYGRDQYVLMQRYTSWHVDQVIDWLEERFSDVNIRKHNGRWICTVGSYVTFGSIPLLHAGEGTTLAEAVCRTAVLAARAMKREGK